MRYTCGVARRLPIHVALRHTRYIGPWANGVRHGKGRFDGYDVGMFEGAFEEGRPIAGLLRSLFLIWLRFLFLTYLR